MNKKLIVFGTRPEFIKLIPIINELKKTGVEKDYLFIFTGQHTELTQDLFECFSFFPDISIPLKNENNSLGHSFSFILQALQDILHTIQKSHTVKLIVGQGDTTSCACAAVCAFLNEIPFFHMEAGLRTYNLQHPFPEEYFRRIISLSTKVHFAPTQTAMENLMHEGIPKNNIVLSGNTIVDAIDLLDDKSSSTAAEKNRNTVLITCHRRENQNGKFHSLIDTIKQLALENPEYNFCWVSHKTPFIENELGENLFKKYSNIYISAPLTVMDMYRLYKQVILIITDSGGIQEEACSFSIPVIIIRENTERMESVNLGFSHLVRDFDLDLKIKFYQVLSSEKKVMHNPYGDGKAAEKIVAYLNSVSS